MSSSIPRGPPPHPPRPPAPHLLPVTTRTALPPGGYFARSTEAKLQPGPGWTGSGCVQRPRRTPALFLPLITLAVTDGSSKVGELRLVAEGGRFDDRVQALTSAFVVLSCLGVPTTYESPRGGHG